MSHVTQLLKQVLIKEMVEDNGTHEFAGGGLQDYTLYGYTGLKFKRTVTQSCHFLECSQVLLFTCAGLTCNQIH